MILVAFEASCVMLNLVSTSFHIEASDKATRLSLDEHQFDVCNPIITIRGINNENEL